MFCIQQLLQVILRLRINAIQVVSWNERPGLQKKSEMENKALRVFFLFVCFTKSQSVYSSSAISQEKPLKEWNSSRVCYQYYAKK